MSEVIDAEVVELSDPLKDMMKAEKKAEIMAVEEDELTAEDQEAVKQYMDQIDLHDTNLVLQYGSAAQKNVADFSEGALSSVRTK